jgi:hypothetical protein
VVQGLVTQTAVMPVLEFPRDRIVGQLDWRGHWADETGPVLATGRVEVPDDLEVGLNVSSVSGKERHGSSWTVSGDGGPVDLSFLRDLPPGAIASLNLSRVVPESLGVVTHLAPGLHHLYLSWSGLTDDAISVIASLLGLTHLQTFGNAFTAAGVQPLAALSKVEHLYLEEETLTVEAFRFVEKLPAPKRLGVMDVPMSPAELAVLKLRLPGVDVG